MAFTIGQRGPCCCPHQRHTNGSGAVVLTRRNLLAGVAASALAPALPFRDQFIDGKSEAIRVTFDGINWVATPSITDAMNVAADAMQRVPFPIRVTIQLPHHWRPAPD
jgi:hypothetical protein